MELAGKLVCRKERSSRCSTIFIVQMRSPYPGDAARFLINTLNISQCFFDVNEVTRLLCKQLAANEAAPAFNLRPAWLKDPIMVLPTVQRQ